jgi:hypothetical protein
LELPDVSRIVVGEDRFSIIQVVVFVGVALFLFLVFLVFVAFVANDDHQGGVRYGRRHGKESLPVARWMARCHGALHPPPPKTELRGGRRYVPPALAVAMQGG